MKTETAVYAAITVIFGGLAVMARLHNDIANGMTWAILYGFSARALAERAGWIR